MKTSVIILCLLLLLPILASCETPPSRGTVVEVEEPEEEQWYEYPEHREGSGWFIKYYHDEDRQVGIWVSNYGGIFVLPDREYLVVEE